MGWVDERKHVAALINENDCERNSYSENQGLLRQYKDFLARWDEDSGLQVVRKVKAASQTLEEIMEHQPYPQHNNTSESHMEEYFSLATYLNTIPFPRNPEHARLRNILLGAYDNDSSQALERFYEEINELESPHDFSELEEARLLFKGVELSLKHGFFGKELKRDNKQEVSYKVLEAMKKYLN